MANITFDNGNGTNIWSDDLNWSGGSKPGSGDIGIFDSTSTANCAVDVNPSCQGIHILTGYTGTVSVNAGISVTLTPPSGTVGFKQEAGTWTGGDSFSVIAGPNVAGNIFELSGGSCTQTSGNWNIKAGDFSKTGGTYSAPSGAILDLGGGTFAGRKFDSGGNSANEQYEKIQPGIGNVVVQNDFKCDGAFNMAMNGTGQSFDFNGFDMECLDWTGFVGTTSSSGKVFLGSGTMTVNRDMQLGSSTLPNGILGETSTIVLQGTGGGTRKFQSGFFHAPAGNTQFNNLTIEGPYDSSSGTSINRCRIGGQLKITASGSWNINNTFGSSTTQILDGATVLIQTGGALTQSVATQGKFFQLEDSAIENLTLEAGTTFDPFELSFAQVSVSGARTIPASTTYRRVRIRHAGSTATDAIFNLASGTFTLTQDLRLESLSSTNDMIVNGDINNPTMNIGQDLELLADDAGDVTLDFGSDTWTIDRNLETNGVGAGAEILNFQSSTIKFGDGGAAHNIDLDGGTVDAGTSTLEKTGAGTATFNGNVSYFNFTFGIGATHTFTAGTSTSFDGTLASTGTLASPSLLRSTIPGTEYNFNAAGAPDLEDKMDVEDSNASAGSAIIALQSIDSGNNTNWFFLSLPSTGGGNLLIKIM